MVHVKLEKKGEDVTKVEAKGHAGYAKYGKDIVCAAVSSVMQTALLGVKDVSDANVSYVSNDETGYLSFTITDATEDVRVKQQAILRAMELGLRDLEKGYKAYVKMEVNLQCL